jgi:hypothetical protein
MTDANASLGLEIVPSDRTDALERRQGMWAVALLVTGLLASVAWGGFLFWLMGLMLGFF